MTASPSTPTAVVRVVGIMRGREISASAVAALEADALVLAWERATPWRIAFTGLDGVTVGVRQLSLYLSSGDVLELEGDDSVAPIARQLIERACAMPELTRGLRSLGSRRGAPGAAHDTWFAPLLAAKRAVSGVSDVQRQVMLIDAANLSRAMAGAMSELAALTAPGDPARQRAVEAALEEDAADMFVALRRAALLADVLRGSALDTQFADWRRWVDALREVFAEADDAWGRCSQDL